MIPCFRQTTRTSYDRNCRQPRISNVPRPGNSMDRNLHAEKHCDKRFLDRVINLILDSGLKALWSLIPFFWALSPFLWALMPVIFWALSPEPIYHVTTLISRHTCLDIQTSCSLPRYQGPPMWPKCGHAIGLSLDELLMSLRRSCLTGKVTKASGPDHGISARLLKDAAPVIAKPIT